MAGRATGTTWIGGLVLLLAAVSAGAADAPPPDVRTALAWRLSTLSSANLGPNQPAAAWRRAAALLEAAHRLAPTEPYFPRLQALALTQIGDVDGAIATIKSFRQIAPGDRVAQIQLIDLYAARLQTVDAKLDYLQSLLDKQDLALPVRAFLASECVKLLAQKSPDQAAKMAGRAVALYPLPQATRQYYELAGRQLPLNERVAALAAVLQANPNQPPYLAEMANLLASNGLADPSLQWYDLAIGVVVRSGSDRPPQFHQWLVDYVAEFIVAGHSAPADTLVGQVLDGDPLDADAWFLKLTLAQGSSEQVTYAQTLELARSALVRRWNMAHDQILGIAPASQPTLPAPPAASDATTAPAAAKVEPLDFAPVLQKLKDSKDAAADRAFIGAAGDLAWFELYFDKKAEAARTWIGGMRAVLPGDSVLLLRLEGWEALVAGQNAQAREIFAKIADKDPLSALGLLRVDQAEKKPPNLDAARKVLDANRTGLPAAIIWQALRNDKMIPVTQPAVADLTAELARFPRPWYSLMDARAMRHVYSVHAEPVEAHVAFGDPMLLRVTIDNNCDFDITLGPDGLLRPDLWFTAQILGLDQQQFNPVAQDRMGGQIVLAAHSSVEQIVRLDEGSLRRALDLGPGASTRVTGTVITNAISASGGMIAGPAGGEWPFSRSFLYMGIPVALPEGKKQMDAALQSSSPADRLRALDVLGGYVKLAAEPNVDESVRKAAADLPQTIARLRSDSSTPVGAWASYLAATYSGGEAREHVITEMSASSDWTTRLLSLVAAGSLPADSQTKLAVKLANDPDPTVKAAAAADADLLRRAATQPAEPSTRPAQ